MITSISTSKMVFYVEHDNQKTIDIVFGAGYFSIGINTNKSLYMADSTIITADNTLITTDKT